MTLRPATSVDEKSAPVSGYLEKLDEPIKGLRIGITPKFNTGADEQVRKAIDESLKIYANPRGEAD